MIIELGAVLLAYIAGWFGFHFLWIFVVAYLLIRSVAERQQKLLDTQRMSMYRGFVQKRVCDGVRSRRNGVV